MSDNARAGDAIASARNELLNERAFSRPRADARRHRGSKSGGSKSSGSKSGGARRDRTDDLLLAKQALSQLSYGPLRDQWSGISNQISREELRRSFDPRISEWGNPPSIPEIRCQRSDVGIFRRPTSDIRPLVSREGMKLPNQIGGFKLTRGTETSQYPEERTSTETPLVVASESGPGQ